MLFVAAYWRSLLLCALLLMVLLSNCTDGQKSTNQKLAEELFDLKHDGDDHDHMNLHGENPSSLLFFHPNDLVVGKRMLLYFSKKPKSSSHFLPRDKAHSIPFSLKELPNLLKFFSFPRGSKQAEAMEDTLQECERPPIKGETKFCATSLESLLDFALRIFGLDHSDTYNHPTLLTSIFHSSHTYSESISTYSFQHYTIVETPREVSASKVIGCHTMPYPFTMFHCHTQEGGSKVYKILLRGDNGDILDAVAACHLDTLNWDPNHVTFRVLGFEPGKPVCHIFPPHGNLVWVHTPPTYV